MGKGHTRAQRKRWAHLTRSVPIDEVAKGRRQAQDGAVVADRARHHWR